MKYLYPTVIFVLLVLVLILSISLWVYVYQSEQISTATRASGLQTKEPTAVVIPTEPVEATPVLPTITPPPVSPTPMQTLTTEILRQSFTLQSSVAAPSPVHTSLSGETNFGTFIPSQQITGYAISGTVTFTGPRAMARILLVDANQNEWLVFEGFPLIAEGTTMQVSEWCEETCLLQEVIPSYLKVEFYNASMTLNQVSYTTESTTDQNDFANKWRELKQNQNEYKIRQINTHMTRETYQWTAGHTTISELSYNEKKKLFTSKVPNLQGLEFYKEGIFAIPDEFGSPPPTQSLLPTTFDWRNRHGKNWVTIAKHQQGCGSCWAFSANAVTEALINIYYNHDLDINIAEQDVICRHPGSCLNGNFLHYAYDALQTTGLVTEDCFVNTGDDITCSYKCADSSEKTWKIRGYGPVNTDDESIKRALIEKGPISFGVASYWHFMTAVGYTTLDDGAPAWYIKNSWGSTWGDDGVATMVIPPYDRYGLIYADTPFISSDPERYQIRCEDVDNDSYCTWGLSRQKPDTCPATCQEEPDCDDTDPTKGAADENQRCVM